MVFEFLHNYNNLNDNIVNIESLIKLNNSTPVSATTEHVAASL